MIPGYSYGATLLLAILNFSRVLLQIGGMECGGNP